MKKLPDELNKKISDRGLKIKYNIYEKYKLDNINNQIINDDVILENKNHNLCLLIERNINKNDDVILIKKKNKWIQLISGIEVNIDFNKEKSNFIDIIEQTNNNYERVDYLIEFMKILPKYNSNLYYKLELSLNDDLEKEITDYDIIISGINTFSDIKNFELKYICGTDNIFRLDIVYKIDTKFVCIMGYYKVIRYREYFVCNTKKHLFYLKKA
ncbi:MAG: hypothetical protein KIT69_09180 [Propionibacteriaceae bacterium]|nr:hypothetical protein [Propionibacteriaceae bacterium]